jgi:hypothetical protein
MNPFILKLKTPIQFGSEKIEKLEFKARPIAKDFKGLPGNLGQDDNMLMLSRLTNVELVAIEMLDGHDYLRANGVLQLFLGNGPGTGSES